MTANSKSNDDDRHASKKLVMVFPVPAPDRFDRERQERRENRMKQEGAQRYSNNVKKLESAGMEDMTGVGVRFMSKIMSTLKPAVIKLQEEAIMKLAKGGTQRATWMLLACISPNRMAYLTARGVFAHRHGGDAFDDGYNEPDPRPLRDVGDEIGTEIIRQRKWDFDREKQRMAKAKKRAGQAFQRPLLCDITGEVLKWLKKLPRKRSEYDKIQSHLRQLRGTESFLNTGKVDSSDRWRDDRLRAGCILVEKLVETCPEYFESFDSKDDGTNGSLVHVRKGKDEKHRTERHVRLKPAIHRELDEKHERTALTSPYLTPMVYPPARWRTSGLGYVGGYLCREYPLISNRSFRSHSRTLGHAVGDEMLSAINAVQATPWKINLRVAEVLRQAWESRNGEKLGLGPVDYVGVEGKEPDQENGKWDDLPPAKKAEYFRARRKRYVKNSQRLTTLRLLRAIDAEDKHKPIWFAHFLDFRGRMYPYAQDNRLAGPQL